MGEKSARKKQYILEKAREVFMEKGYKRVTMKDIVEACEISRGGLYLYFDSTNQIFMELLSGQNSDASSAFGGKISADASATDLLLQFLKEQKKIILFNGKSLTQATYEYYFENKETAQENYLKKQFEAQVKILQTLIDAGCEDDEFYCEDSYEAARNIVFLLEGLKISAQTVGITAQEIDNQMLYVLTTLGAGEE